MNTNNQDQNKSQSNQQNQQSKTGDTQQSKTGHTEQSQTTNVPGGYNDGKSKSTETTNQDQNNNPEVKPGQQHEKEEYKTPHPGPDQHPRAEQSNEPSK